MAAASPAARAAPTEVHYTADPVACTLDSLVGKDRDFLAAIAQLKNQLTEVATTFSDMEAAEKVAPMRELFTDCMVLDNEVNMHIQALQSLKRSYQPSASSMDFKAVLEEGMNKLVKSQKFNPEQSRDLKAFNAETGGQGGSGSGGVGAAAGDEEEEDVVFVAGNNGGLMNDKCPITMKSVFDLQQPMTDEKGFIYDKTAILKHIRDASRGGNPARCPVAGAVHIITEQSLKPAVQLERYKRKERMKKAMGIQGGSGVPAAGAGGGARPGTRDSVYDVDDV